MSCMGRIDGGALYSRGIFGGVMYSKSAAHVHISEITTENIALRSSSRIYGGVLFLESALNVVVKGTVAANAILTVSNPALVAECFGGVMHFSQSALCLYCMEMCQFVIAFFPNRQCGASDTNVPQQEVLYPSSALSNTTQTSTRALIFPPRFLARVASCAPV